MGVKASTAHEDEEKASMQSHADMHGKLFHGQQACDQDKRVP